VAGGTVGSTSAILSIRSDSVNGLFHLFLLIMIKPDYLLLLVVTQGTIFLTAENIKVRIFVTIFDKNCLYFNTLPVRFFVLFKARKLIYLNYLCEILICIYKLGFNPTICIRCIQLQLSLKYETSID
jgi:hypothetical protein